MACNKNCNDSSVVLVIIEDRHQSAPLLRDDNASVLVRDKPAGTEMPRRVNDCSPGPYMYIPFPTQLKMGNGREIKK